ncbi:MAG TPA: dephospho-CoA kinase [Gammaproteobacteria bacterium]|nr:dephospho-CoA kinase [Gammaproteobacteria bacterium]
MLTIGLTGGVGSGKSTAARFFSELNVGIVDADLIAKDLLNTPQMADTVKRQFGSQICNPNGELNRYKLRQLIFSDLKARLWLEEFLHPQIRAQIIVAITRCTSAYVVVVIPLLVETQKEDYIDRILLIDVPESVQISRLTNRDKITIEEAQTMLAAQASRKARLSCAHDVIENTGDLQQLKNKVHNLHGYYLQLAQNSKNRGIPAG